MTRFTIASFNVKNLIGADKEYYKFQSYTPEEYAWKQDWMADQLLTMDADIVGFQEIFEEDALRSVIAEADAMGATSNAASITDKSRRYHRKAIFRKLAYTPYGQGGLAFAPNVADGGPGQRRPGVAIVSRFGFVGTPEVIQDLPEPFDIPFSALRRADGDAVGDDDDSGYFRLRRLSRPILKARIPVGDQTITVFNCHLKSKLGEHITPEPSDLTKYDPSARALGSLRAALRRMVEAWVLRREIIKELDAGNSVMVLGDFNDGEHAVSSKLYQARFRSRTTHGCCATTQRPTVTATPTQKTNTSAPRSTRSACIQPKNCSCAIHRATWSLRRPLAAPLKVLTKSTFPVISTPISKTA